MNTLLRKIAEWKGRRRAAQVIVFDAGAEVERADAFLRGAMTGIALATGVFLVAAPRGSHPDMVDEIAHRDALLAEAERRVTQAADVADVCLDTAARLEETLSSYQEFLSGRAAVPPVFGR